jgi:hypothetical protein
MEFCCPTGLDNLKPTGEPDWEHARFKEPDSCTWDLEALGLAAEQRGAAPSIPELPLLWAD